MLRFEQITITKLNISHEDWNKFVKTRISKTCLKHFLVEMVNCSLELVDVVDCSLKLVELVYGILEMVGWYHFFELE